MRCALLYKGPPRSYNAHSRSRFQDRLRKDSKRLVFPPEPMRSPSLYSKVFYFHRGKRDIDADNISKPVLDALRGVAFIDDAQVCWRLSAKVDVSRPYTVRQNDIAAEAYAELIESLGDETAMDLLYVEVSHLQVQDVSLGREPEWNVTPRSPDTSMN